MLRVRRLSWFLVVVLLIGMLFACQNSDETSMSSDSTTTADPKPSSQETSVPPTAVAGAPIEISVDPNVISPVTHKDDAQKLIERIVNPTDDAKIPRIELAPDVVHETGTLSVYRYRQVYRGIPILGQSVVLATNKNGVVLDVTGTVLSTGTVDTEAKISKAQAYQAGIDHIAKGYANSRLVQATRADMALWQEAQSVYRLVYPVDVLFLDEQDILRCRRLIVDAQDAQIRSDFSIDQAASASGTPVSIQKTCEGMTGNRVITVQKDGDTYTLVDHERQLYGYRIVSPESDGSAHNQNIGRSTQAISWAGEKASPTKSETDAMANLAQVIDYYKKNLAYQTYVGDQRVLTWFIAGMIHLPGVNPNSQDVFPFNACYYPVYSDKGKPADLICFTRPTSSSLFVSAHEYTHAVFQRILADNPDRDRSLEHRAVNEAISDIFATLVVADNQNRAPDWNAENKRDLMNPGSGYYRSYWSFLVSKPFIERLHHITGSGPEYAASTILSHAAYLMNQMVKENGYVEDTPRPELLPPKLLAKLWYDALYLLGGNVTFLNCRRAVEISARNLASQGLLSELQVRTITEAFDQVKLYIPFTEKPSEKPPEKPSLSLPVSGAAVTTVHSEPVSTASISATKTVPYTATNVQKTQATIKPSEKYSNFYTFIVRMMTTPRQNIANVVHSEGEWGSWGCDSGMDSIYFEKLGIRVVFFNEQCPQMYPGSGLKQSDVAMPQWLEIYNDSFMVKGENMDASVAELIDRFGQPIKTETTLFPYSMPDCFEYPLDKPLCRYRFRYKELLLDFLSESENGIAHLFQVELAANSRTEELVIILQMEYKNNTVRIRYAPVDIFFLKEDIIAALKNDGLIKNKLSELPDKGQRYLDEGYMNVKYKEQAWLSINSSTEIGIKKEGHNLQVVSQNQFVANRARLVENYWISRQVVSSITPQNAPLYGIVFRDGKLVGICER